jgi:putative flippase GtrA
MSQSLKDPRQFIRFFFVNGFGTIFDYGAAVLLVAVFFVPELIASTIGFLLGTSVNYVGHTLFSYEHTDKSNLSLGGYAKYVGAVMLSLVVRLVVVALGGFTALPFWLVLLIAIGASFVASYVIATLWVFKKDD